MPLFTRRTLQRLLHDCRDILSASDSKAFATAFNSDRKNSLALQWELVLLSALREVAGVQYEPDTGGQQKLDFLCHGPDLETIGLEVTAVSDEYNEQRNPLNQFQKELIRRIVKAGLKPSGYRMTIGNRILDSGGKQTLLLALPEVKDFHLFFDSEFDLFLYAISRAPKEQHQIRRWSEIVKVQIVYSPDNMFMGISYSGLDETSLRDNSVFRALDKKATKIHKSGFLGPVGIIVCDAGARLFYQGPPLYSVALPGAVSEFLREHTEVSAVLTVRTHVSNASRKGHQPHIDVYENPYAENPFSSDWLAKLKSLSLLLPVLQADAFNAQSLLDFTRGKIGRTHSGYEAVFGARMVKIKVSARGVFALLAGAENCQTLLARMGLAPNALVQKPINPFKGQHRAGARLVAVRILESPETDDDWIEFEFEGTDPAAAPIKP